MEDHIQAHTCSCKTLIWFVNSFIFKLSKLKALLGFNYNSFAVVHVILQPNELLWQLFCVDFKIPTFCSKLLNKSFKKHRRLCTMVIFPNGTLYGQDALLVTPTLIIDTLHTTLLSILQNISPPLNFDTFDLLIFSFFQLEPYEFFLLQWMLLLLSNSHPTP